MSQRQSFGLSVPGICCDRCALVITDALDQLDGIDVIRVDIARRRVTVGFRAPATHADILLALTQAGYHLEAPTPISTSPSLMTSKHTQSAPRAHVKASHD